uniref:CobQ/CobB/MinD/ParA nucleotide binding domain-containing protein n=1 Tax=Candidatus Kentrum sp. SD TaxID=2126332 RepID=A0A451BML3_9GAMM|nr:MAG: CobQ/CobB/MinD/ParA nucleotide binding domain-containing protein [Candidatus Kentron sp. SD]VFK45370.1 MAG: CobQ/CobB/MinD/ParA nucleotide binding domain-containing protein [Candidatus Kentron sp. SD]VFK79532.1 MAG: CobQ/CobB/MinD/ParA nucleotide binding domain-containing protein [Candidatus Kentron sp. SD]
MNGKNAWVFTFFAFKGGTGRTSALANVARYLAEERGYRVGVIDFDMEAPGLPMQPLFDIGLWEKDAQKNRGKETDTRSSWERWREDVVNRCPGFADLFLELAKGPEVCSREGELPWQFEKNTWDRLPSHVIPCPSQRGGQVLLMPAAMESVTRKDEFKACVREFLHRTSGAGDAISDTAFLTARILAAFIDIYKLDYLFLDGRTGMGGFTPVFLYSVPHALVLFLGLNDQNIDGSLSVFDEKLASEPGQSITQAPVIPVLTPVPTSGMDQLEVRLDEVGKRLGKKRVEREKERAGQENDASYIYEIPDSIRIHLPYVDKLAYAESYVPVEYPNHSLAKAYREIADRIEGIVAYRADSRRTKKSSVEDIEDRLRNLNKPLLLEVENTNREHLERFFLDRMGWERKSREGSSEKQQEPCEGCAPDEGPNECACCRYGPKDNEKIHIELKLCSATYPKASWARLDPGNSPSDADIVAIPYSSLHRVVNASYYSLDERLGDWRKKLQSGAESPLPKIYDHRYLDEWYPGWRHISSVEGRIWGIPFAVTTTFLLGNKERLKKACVNYWEGIHGTDGEIPRQSNPNAFFVPSNFDLLLDLIESQSDTDENGSCFRVALEGKAAYYEWLNVVLSYGLYDIRSVNGGWPQVLPEERILELVEPTRMFLRLADQTVQAKGKDKLKNYSMGNLIEDFRGEKEKEGEVSLYMGWSDSVSFDENGDLSLLGAKSLEPVIGRFPRDIRYPRRPLVDGWLLCFPKKSDASDDDKRLEVAECLVGAMLEADSQERMLKNGFPSPSRTLLARERERLGHGNHSDYANFLHTLMDSLENGHWVPPDDRSRRMMEKWSDRLREWLIRLHETPIDFDDENVTEAFRQEIESELRKLLCS